MPLGRDDIQKLIPHRDPFLWIDTVSEITVTTIVAEKFLDPQLPVFAGHYPEFPIFPGVLLCEAAFQAGAILIAKNHPVTDDAVPVVTRVNNVKFRRMVRPGDSIRLEVKLTEVISSAYLLTGKISVGNDVAVRLEFTCVAAKVG
ncbi:MAG: beta-hydroxyacyl-ACP dehydratase [Planctomycetota bacterium]|nr:beta-hydroxyacyl-ACP dehydratase [Planctomycetota bacterium]MDA1214556.1 beta-hydroxyacyl-ACP dehydratase [Planctomycetota bacterium]